MKREDIKEIYSIGHDKGVLVLTKEEVGNFVRRVSKYGYAPDLLVNPEIKIIDGVLTIKGERLSFESIKKVKDGYYWHPTPTRELKKNWKDIIFFDKSDIITQNIVSWSISRLPFRKVEKDVEHLEEGRYLQTTGYVDTQTTSNYRLVGYEEEKEIRGIL